MRLIVIDDIFHPRDRRVMADADVVVAKLADRLGRAPTIAEVLEDMNVVSDCIAAAASGLDDVGDLGFAAIADGGRVEVEQPIDGEWSELIVIFGPKNIISIIVFAVVTALVSTGISLLINLLFGPSVPNAPNTGLNESPTYSWNGIRNTLTQGRPIGVVFGDHRVGGQFISLYRRNASFSSTEQYLYMVLCLGHGPVESVGLVGAITQDTDQLLPGGLFADDFDAYTSSMQHLDDTPRGKWENIDGDDTGVVVDDFGGGNIVAVAYGGPEGAGSFRAKETIGLAATNQEVEFTIEDLDTGAGDRGIAVALNMEDDDNCHRVRFAASNVMILESVVGGTPTTIQGYIVAASDTIILRRLGDDLTVFINGTPQADEAADTSLTSRNVGIQRTGVVGRTSAINDFKARAAAILPADMHLNGISARSYRDITAWVRMGSAESTVLPAAFSKVIQAYNPNITLSTTWIEYEFHTEVEGFQVNIDFPGGLFDQSGGGGLNSEDVIIEIEYREDDLDAWTPVSGSPFTIDEQLTTGFTRTIFVEPGTPLEGERQMIRIRRQSASESLDSSLISDRCVFADVNEIHRDDRQTYDGFALMALQIKATEQLSGGTPVVTNMVRGLPVPTWDGTSDPDKPILTFEQSTNPAWVALFILLDKERGLGNWIGVADIDIEAFKSWADWNDEVVTYHDWEREALFTTTQTEAALKGTHTVVVTDATDAAEFPDDTFVTVGQENVNQVVTAVDIGGGKTRLTLLFPIGANYPANFPLNKVALTDEISEVRHTYNGVFDQELSAWDALIRVCQAGRAVPIKVGNRISVRVEREASPVQHVNEANMVKDSFEISYIGSSERVDTLEAQYLDAAEDFDQKAVEAGGFPPLTSDKEVVRSNISLYGVTSVNEARREAYYNLRARRLLGKKCKFSMALDGIAAEPGDVISIGATLPNWSHWTGRARGSLGELYLSHEVTLDSGVSYQAIVRDGANVAGTTVNITATAGTYPAGSPIATDGDVSVALTDSLVTIGTVSVIDTEWRITKTNVNDDLTVDVEAVEYNPAIYGLFEWAWPFGEGGCSEIPEPGSDLACGECYFVPFQVYFGVCPNEDPDACPCFVGDIEVTITGDCADCVTIVGEITADGMVIQVDEGCEDDSFTIEVCFNGAWYGCGASGTQTDGCCSGIQPLCQVCPAPGDPDCIEQEWNCCPP